MEIKLIKTETDYEIALKKAETIFDAKPGTPEGDELEILGLLIDKYENDHFPIDAPDPIEAIKIRMEEMNLTQTDLKPAIGAKSRVSEVLNRKRPLTIGMVRNLSAMLNLPASLLIREYNQTRPPIKTTRKRWENSVLKEGEQPYIDK